MSILVTGGLGYIGAHVVDLLLRKGQKVLVIDNLCHSKSETFDLLQQRHKESKQKDQLVFLQIDLKEIDQVDELFRDHPIWCVVHLAGLKSVQESNEVPLLYYENNLLGSLNLLKTMQKYGTHRILFSSSATVYGAEASPVTEQTPTGRNLTNTYGRTKWMIEQMILDQAHADSEWKVLILRYFNPVHEGIFGEYVLPGIRPANLYPAIRQAILEQKEVLVFGTDYPTKDGTAERDYIHILDLAEAHLLALQYMEQTEDKKYLVFNIGRGTPVSVLEMIQEIEKQNDLHIKRTFLPRRDGDLASIYANADLAKRILGFEAKRTLAEMCTFSIRDRSLFSSTSSTNREYTIGKQVPLEDSHMEHVSNAERHAAIR